jgi:hypothetical protein
MAGTRVIVASEAGSIISETMNAGSAFGRGDCEIAGVWSKLPLLEAPPQLH